LAADPRDVFFHSPIMPPYLDLGPVCLKIAGLQFQGRILQKVEQFLRAHQLQTPFFGLQIRKTDFGAAGAKEDELFALVQNCGDKRFFVCSDSKEVESKFQSLPNTVTHPKEAYVEKLVEGGWNAPATDHSGRVYACNVNRNAQSVIDAVVDLLILSHSQIVKTSESTFLNAALLIKTARENGLSRQPETDIQSEGNLPGAPERY
jgi:hypothetical protein